MAPRLWLVLCGLGAALVLALVPGPAFACSQVPTCAPPVRLFPEGARVPGNLVYFKVTAADPGVLTLRASDGRVVPASIRTIGLDRVFAPDADLPPHQRLELEYSTVCPLPVGPQPAQGRFAFTTSEPQPLEMPTPRLTLEVLDEDSDHPAAHGIAAAYATLKYEAICQSCSAAHLTDTHFGGHEGWGHVRQDRIDLLTTCEGLQVADSCTGEAFAPPGRYKVEAWSSVVGAPREPAHAVREVELQCGLDGCAVRGSRRGAQDGGAVLAWVALALLCARVRTSAKSSR